MFNIKAVILDKKSPHYDYELDSNHPKFKPQKLSRCFHMLREDNYEIFKQKIIDDLQSSQPELIKLYISPFSKPIEIYNDWNWKNNVNVGITLDTQHIVNDQPIIKTVLFKNWQEYINSKDFYFNLQPSEPGFFSSGSIVIYKED